MTIYPNIGTSLKSVAKCLIKKNKRYMSLSTVIPAKAGIHLPNYHDYYIVDSRLRGNDFSLGKITRTFDIYMTGRIVKTIPFTGLKLNVDMRGLPQGVYSYRISKGGNLLKSGSLIKR